MKALVLLEYGGPQNLRFMRDEPLPPVGPKEVRIRVRATSVNPIDWKLRSGALRSRMPIELPAILGRDLAGEVAELGSEVSGFSKGMRVMALTNGTYAEYCVTRADLLCSIPAELSFEQAAALPLVVLTGSQLIERAVKIRKGQTVLVTGAVGGVGRTAVHVSRKHGARVFAGVRERQREDASTLGAEAIVALDNAGEIAQLSELDAIADTIDGPTIGQLLPALRRGGILGSVLGVPEQAAAAGIHVEAIMAQPDSSRLHELAADVARGEFTIPIAKTLPLEQGAEAHRLAEQGKVGGKIILVP